jgi:hypothetical protein
MRLALDRFSDSQTFPLMPTRVTGVDELYGSKLRLGDALGAANVDFAGGWRRRRDGAILVEDSSAFD